MRRLALALLLLVLLVPACSGGNAQLPSGHVSSVTFSDTTEASGIDAGNASFGTWGAAWGDYNNDGYADLFINRHALPPILYRNNRDGTFTDVTQAAGLYAGIRAEDGFLLDRHGCAWGDYDGDAYLDLYCATGAEIGTGSVPNQLFHNQRDGTFGEVAASLGVDDGPGRGRAVNWLDYDGDGGLDLYVANTRRPGYPSRLFSGQGAAGFTDASSAAGVDDVVDLTGGSAWSDYDGDGRPDLFVGTYDGLILHRNRGDGAFITVAGRVVGLDADRIRSASFGDFNNDGRPDVFVARIGETAKLYSNRGDGTFEDVTTASGVNVDRAAVGVWGDFNNDGYLDLFVVREYDPKSRMNLPDALFLNNGDGTFSDAAIAAGVTGSASGAGESAAIADFNNDGFLDIAVTDAGWQEDVPGGPILAPLNNPDFLPGKITPYAPAKSAVRLYTNKGNTNHWLEIRLAGSINTFAYGAKVWLTAGGKHQFRELTDGVVRYGQNDSVLHFGVGQATKIDEVRIQWPSGDVQTLKNVSADHVIRVEQAAVKQGS